MRVKTGNSQTNLLNILAHADASAGRKSSLDRLDVTWLCWSSAMSNCATMTYCQSRKYYR